MTGVTIEQLDRVLTINDKDLLVILPFNANDKINASVEIRTIKEKLLENILTEAEINKILENYITSQLFNENNNKIEQQIQTTKVQILSEMEKQIGDISAVLSTLTTPQGGKK